jgi:hypothetical protein
LVSNSIGRTDRCALVAYQSHRDRQIQPIVGGGSKTASVFDVTIDYLVSDTDEDFKEVRIEDKNLMERVKLIDSLEEDDKSALIRVIDSMPTKKKILNLITKENTAEQRV